MQSVPNTKTSSTLISRKAFFLRRCWIHEMTRHMLTLLPFYLQIMCIIFVCGGGPSSGQYDEYVSKLMGKRVIRPRGCHVEARLAYGNLLVSETC